MGLVEGVVRRLVASVGTVIVGKEQEVELCVLALLCGGHVLIEDVPGVGKTMLAKAMARATGCDFERLQFTPDLLPGDVTGVSVFNLKTSEFEFRKGPIFAQVLLADEINRATPKTQSALLEAMEEGQVTVDGHTHPLPSPFIVLATQNPIELGGTFPLPEAQVDRFLVKVNLGYLDLADEVAMLDRFQRESPLDDLAAVTDAAEIDACRQELQTVFCHHSLKEYCVRIVQRTRENSDVALGASPRGSLGLLHAAQARAAAKGRDYVTPDDIKELAHRVLGHRIVLRANAELRGITSAQVIDEVLGSEVVPAERQLMAGEGVVSSRVPLLAGIAALSFFAGITGIHLAYTLTYVLLALLILAFIWTRAIARRISVDRSSPEGSYSVGEPFSEHFTIHNRSLLWVPYCEVHDRSEIPGYAAGRACALGAGDSVSWTARGHFTSRGRHRFGPLEARIGDPFGLFNRTVRLAARSEVTVYPALHPLEDIGPLWSGDGAGDMRRGKAVDVAPEVSSVRDYNSTDGLSRIHWASTARTGRLMSRTYDTRYSADLLVILDLRAGVHAGQAPESSLEYAVSIAASIVNAVARRGQAVGLITNDADMRAFGAGRGEAQRMRLLDYLATARDNGSAPLAHVVSRHGDGWRGRGGMVVVSGDRDSAWVEALVDSGTRGQRHLAVLLETSSFGAAGPPMRIPAAWRLALDWWLVRRGDVLGSGERARAAGD